MNLRDEVKRRDGAHLYKNVIGYVICIKTWKDGREMVAVDDQSGGITWHELQELEVTRTAVGEGMAVRWVL